jgi:hypothetical protein
MFLLYANYFAGPEQKMLGGPSRLLAGGDHRDLNFPVRGGEARFDTGAAGGVAG